MTWMSQRKADDTLREPNLERLAAKGTVMHQQ